MRNTRPVYQLGYSREEHERLILQGQFIGKLTHSLLHQAGLKEGMKVLDIGCGMGDVSLLLHSFVGESGHITALDQSEKSVEVAQERFNKAGIDNISFLVDNLEDLQLNEQFDAVVGRLILLHVKDPVKVIRRLKQLVKPGGLIIIQEMDVGSGRAIPELPIYTQCGDWIVSAFQRAMIHVNMGSVLASIFRQTGIEEAQFISNGRVEQGTESEIYDWVAQTVRTLLPAIEKTGVAKKEEIEIDSLAERFRHQAVEAGAVIHTPLFIGAWGTCR